MGFRLDFWRRQPLHTLPAERPVLEWDPSSPFPEVDPFLDKYNPLLNMLEDEDPSADLVKRYMNRGLAAAAGAFMSTAVCTPFDVVKVRMQTGQAAAQAASMSADALRAFSGSAASGTVGSGKRPATSQTVHWLPNGAERRSANTPPASATATRTSPGWLGTYANAAGGLRRDASAALGTFRTLAMEEGAGGLWRGLGVSVGYVIPTTILHFVLYEALMGTVRERDGSVGVAAPAMSGGLARGVAVATFAPLEMIRMNVMAGGRVAQGSTKKAPLGYPKPPHVGARNWLDAGRMVLANHGAGGFWTGIRATLARDVPYSATYWLVYENVRTKIADAKVNQKVLRQERYAGPGGGVPAEFNAAPIENFISGGFSAIVACILTNPVDVVKTRHQVQVADKGMCKTSQTDPLRMWKVRCQKCHCMADAKLGVWDTLLGIARTEGPQALWTGLGVRIAKAFPANAIMMMTFEATKEYLDSRI